MLAVVQDRHGEVRRLALRDVARPKVGNVEVLVRVVAAGVDRGLLHTRGGRPRLTRPATSVRGSEVMVPGTDFAGRVEAVGAHASRFAPGDEVYGTARGTYAEYVAAPQSKVALKPPRLGFEEAALLPSASSVALQAVRDHGKVRAGERVLVVGASGAVGSIAVQVAKAFGGYVTGVCRRGDVAMVLRAGAQQAITYQRCGFTDGVDRYDVILDVFGDTSWHRLRRLLTSRGRLVIVGGEGDRWVGGVQRRLRMMLLTSILDQQLRSFAPREDADTLGAVNDLVTAGRVRPVLDRSYPLVDAARLDAGHGSGRFALTV